MGETSIASPNQVFRSGKAIRSEDPTGNAVWFYRKKSGQIQQHQEQWDDDRFEPVSLDVVERNVDHDDTTVSIHWAESSPFEHLLDAQPGDVIRYDTGQESGFDVVESRQRDGDVHVKFGWVPPLRPEDYTIIRRTDDPQIGKEQAIQIIEETEEYHDV